jgi:hypothetical protein
MDGDYRPKSAMLEVSNNICSIKFHSRYKERFYRKQNTRQFLAPCLNIIAQTAATQHKFIKKCFLHAFKLLYHHSLLIPIYAQNFGSIGARVM